jgi:hypothetical protein
MGGFHRMPRDGFLDHVNNSSSRCNKRAIAHDHWTKKRIQRICLTLF